jgi:hypothetical protein
VPVAVSSSDNLRAFDSIGRPGDEPDESRRRRWCAFVWLEAIQMTFLALRHGLIEESYGQQASRQQLEVILRDDLVYWLVINRGFHPAFAAYCTEIRQRVCPQKPTDYSEAEAIAGLAESRGADA